MGYFDPDTRRREIKKLLREHRDTLVNIAQFFEEAGEEKQIEDVIANGPFTGTNWRLLAAVDVLYALGYLVHTGRGVQTQDHTFKWRSQASSEDLDEGELTKAPALIEKNPNLLPDNDPN